MRPAHNASVQDWLEYIESIHPSEIDLGLERVVSVKERLKLFKTRKPFVFTIAGTNGKGTTTAALSSLSHHSGHSVGWYSSPHIQTFNERFRINQELISDAALVEAFEQVENAREETSLSYFEFTTLAAFAAFEHANLDVWVLEVGLGGRLDAVNVIDPDVSVITNIAKDHEAFLSSDLNVIGMEKAGICRSGKPVVLGTDKLPKGLWNAVTQHEAVVYPFNNEHGVDSEGVYWGDHSRIDFSDVSIPFANAATALQSFYLSPFECSEGQILAAFKDIRLMGRCQRMSYKGRDIILDVGHNPHAGAYLAEKLSSQRFHVVLGMLADKDPSEFVQAIHPITESITAVSLDVPRGLSHSNLVERVKGTFDRKANNVGEAIELIINSTESGPLFIGGSFYTVCDALAYLERGIGT